MDLQIVEESEVVVLKVEEPDRLDRFLKVHFPEWSRTKLAQAIEDGFVSYGGLPAKPGTPVKPGGVVTVKELPDPVAMNLEPIDIPLEFLFEDEHMLVVSKPRGLPTHPASSFTGPTLVNALLFHAGQLSQGSADFRPGIVHRLDKETTGLLMIAKTDFAHANLAKQIAEKTAERRYFAIAYGTMEQPRFRVAAPIARDSHNRLKMACDPNGREAATQFVYIRESGGGALLACKLETGRTHQIRVHLQAIGHPVGGDELYAKGSWAEGPMQLHAGWLAFNHPKTGERMSVYQAPPEDFFATGLTEEMVSTIF